MLAFGKLWQALLERALSFVALARREGTGSAVQVGLLRAMGAHVAGPVSIGCGARIVRPGYLNVGRYVVIGENARLMGFDEIFIGDDFLASDGLTLNTGGHDPETLAVRTAPIRIGERVWCGANVTVCAGVTIGDDVVIGAGAVVVRDLPDGCIAVGVPAKPVRELRRAPDTALWSLWPERSGRGNYATRGPFVQLLFRLRARI